MSDSCGWHDAVHSKRPNRMLTYSMYTYLNTSRGSYIYPVYIYICNLTAVVFGSYLLQRGYKNCQLLYKTAYSIKKL